ncbi:hypothetical protein [Haloarcula amylolytica]|nr:hypothetical protein [Haloarcula amylolytica]
MAEGVQCSTAPLCWRVLTPSLVKLLPLPLATSFMTISLASLALSGVLVYEISKAYGFKPCTAFVGTALFVNLSSVSGYYLYNFWLTDPIAYVFTLLGIYAVFTERNWLFLIALLVGVTAKESVLFVAPLYFTFPASKIINRGTIKRFATLVAPAVTILVLIRVSIRAGGEYSYVNTFLTIGVPRITGLDAEFLTKISVSAFGFLIVFPVFNLRKTIPTLFRFLPFLILVYAQLLVATDVARLIMMGFPAFVIMSLEGLTALTDRLSDLGSVSVPVFVYLVPCLLIFYFNLGSITPVSFATEGAVYTGFTILIMITIYVENWV